MTGEESRYRVARARRTNGGGWEDTEAMALYGTYAPRFPVDLVTTERIQFAGGRSSHRRAGFLWGDKRQDAELRATERAIVVRHVGPAGSDGAEQTRTKATGRSAS